jgi:phosphoribosyl-ATP pyrophosphohydrolase/phosphoribosyl-AMP cyclohydrolase/histidinol dehydrogenase
MAAATAIVEDVRTRGETALRYHSERLGDSGAGDPLVLEPAVLEASLDQVDPAALAALERMIDRVRSFAAAQRRTLSDLDVEVPGGRAGHRLVPVASAGAYAPGGRYPLPSSVVMTVIPARVAGVDRVWVASPRPGAVTRAAAWLAGADGLLAVGGAQAIAALAFGTVSPACDLIVGPGTHWVTAAKKHLYGEVGIDGLAGPSEILVIADDHADPALVAADLAAQAEHDPEAVPGLIATEERLVHDVDTELERLLADLPTAATARAALANGWATVVPSLELGAELADRFAPEHLALHVSDPEELAMRVTAYGGVFLGDGSAEVFGDYGAGPNHVLPTSGGARYQSGLSVATFLRSPTWLTLDDPGALAADTALLARLEGLEAHARAALGRTGISDPKSRSHPRVFDT